MWKPLEKLIKRASTTASVTITDNVKTEAKKLGKGLIPTLLGIGAAVAGVIIFRNTTAEKALTGAIDKATPAISNMTITTNNYFFDEAMKADVLSKIIKE